MSRPGWKLLPVQAAFKAFNVVVTGLLLLVAVTDWATDATPLGDHYFVIAAAALFTVSVVFIGVPTLRTRVRLTTDGVEVRTWNTTVIAYDQITDARVDRGTDDKMIKVTVREGDPVLLPAPLAGWRKPSDTTLDDAVAMIRNLAGLGPAPPRQP